MIFGDRGVIVGFKGLEIRYPVPTIRISLGSGLLVQKDMRYTLDCFGDILERYSEVGFQAGYHRRVGETGFDEPDVEESKVRYHKLVAQ